MSDPAHLLAANAKWAANIKSTDPSLLPNLSQGQSPKVLWIGCGDSRVPESVITDSKPGDIFVHRNIANQFHLYDDNALSVLTFAVEVLHVDHIVVVGHTQCGGAVACQKAAEALVAAGDPEAAVTTPIVTVPTLPATAPINVWLAPLTRLAVALQAKAKANPGSSHAHAHDKKHVNPVLQLVEANVRAQVANITSTDSGRKVSVHGWVYEIETGTLRDLGVSHNPESVIEIRD